jgi:hypothetical protein
VLGFVNVQASPYRLLRLGALLALATSSFACGSGEFTARDAGVSGSGGDGSEAGGSSGDGNGGDGGGGGDDGGSGSGGMSGVGGMSGEGGSAGDGSCGGMQCELGQQCEAERCQCLACPRGGIPGLPREFCLTPSTSVATADRYWEDGAPNGTPEGAIDGTQATYWSAGDYQGTLIVSLPEPTAMASVVLLMNGNFIPTPGIVHMTVTVRDQSGATEIVQGEFADTDMLPIALELPLSNPSMVDQITIHGQSGETWITLLEVLYAGCTSR